MTVLSFIKKGTLWTKLPILIGIVLIIVLALPFFAPSAFYKGVIETRLEKASGLDFDFSGDFDFSLMPSIRMDAKDVMFEGQLVKGIDTVGKIDHVILDIDFWEFLTGDLYVNEYILQSPSITVDGNFLPHLPQTLRSYLKGAQKQDIRYLEFIVHLIEKSVFDVAEINEGSFYWVNSPWDKISIQKINISAEKPKSGRDFVIEASSFVNDRSADLSMRLQRPDNFLRGYRSKLDILLDSNPLKIEFRGNAAHRHSFVAQGDAIFDIPSIYEFCRWFTAPEKCDEKSDNIKIDANVKLRDQRLQIEKAHYRNDDFTLSANGAIDFKRSKPEIIGDVLIPLDDISSVFSLKEKLKSINFDKLYLDAYNANINILHQGLTLSNEEIIKPRVKILLDDGRLSLNVNRLEALNGISNARIRWHQGIDNGYLDMRIDTNGLNSQDLQSAMGRDFKLAGSLKASLEVQALGYMLEDFIDTARIYGEFSLFEGIFLDPNVVRSLSGQKLNRLDFNELKGRIKGQNGRINSHDIKVSVPYLKIFGAANYDFINDRTSIILTSQIPSKTQEGISEDQEGFVEITGPIDALRISSSAKPMAFISTPTETPTALIPQETEDGFLDGGADTFDIEESDLLD